jgi:hypothetical protein
MKQRPVLSAWPKANEPHSSGSVTRVLEPAPEPAVDPRCLWCDRTFTTRATGGSTQRFCCAGHRQQFWIAARLWTMRAIKAGPILSVDCLKASHTSVHAVPGGILLVSTSPIIAAYRAKSEPSYAGSCITASRPANRARVFPEGY